MPKFLQWFLTSLLIIILTACGGGSGSSDSETPEITLNGEKYITIKQGVDYIELGAIATDDVDGNVEVSISGSVDTSTIGRYTVSYTAFDTTGNSMTILRYVNVVDGLAPEIVLNGDAIVNINEGEQYIEMGATATDNKDAEVEVEIENDINTAVSGEYEIIYTSSDAAGNAARLVRHVIVRALDQDMSNFSIEGTSLSVDEVSNLIIEGTSEDGEGNKGTFNETTDVIAKKEIVVFDLNGTEYLEDQVVFRSFHIGKWKGKLNEETTLLARIFIDPVLMNVDVEEKNRIAETISNSKTFEMALLNQKLYMDNPKVFESVYLESILELTSNANDLVSQETIQGAMKRYNKNSSLIQMEHRKGSSDIDNIGGSIRLQYDNDINSFIFKNYHNVYMGLREYDPVKDYSFVTTLEDNLINPVQGGVIGTGISKLVDTLNLEALGSPADTVMVGRSFDGELYSSEGEAKPNQEKTYEIYKYANISDMTTPLNILLISDAILGGFGDRSKKIKKLKSKAVDFTSGLIESVDTGVALLETMGVLSDYGSRLFVGENQDTVDFVYGFENTADNIRTYIDKIKPFLSDKNRYDEYLDTDSTNMNNRLMEMLWGPKKYPESLALKSALASIEDTKKRNIIYTAAYFSQKYYNINLPGEALENYNYYSVNDMHYIAPLWTLFPRDEAKKILEKYKYGTGAHLGSKGIPAYIKLMSKNDNVPSFMEWLKDVIKKTSSNSLKKLEDMAKFSDLIRTTTRSVVNADLFSYGSLKVVFKFLKDSDLISIDANVIAAKIAKKLTPGLAQAKAALAVNEAVSWSVGTFTLPNKMYFKVQTDSQGNIELKYPPFAILGILSDDVEEQENWVGNKIYRNESSENILAVTGSYHKPVYNVHFIAKDQSSIFENNSAFPNNTLVTMNYNIRRSTTGTRSNFDDDLDNVNNVNQGVKISPETIADGGVLNYNMVNSGDYGYYFDLYDAWRVEQGLSDKGVTIANLTRGVYKEWIEAQFNYPRNFEVDASVSSDSDSRYIYKLATETNIKENLTIERTGEDSLKIINNNDFGICFNVYYDQTRSVFSDDTYHYGDECIKSDSSYNLSLKRFKDDDQYNDVKIIFFDVIALKYFEEEKYNVPRYYNWEEQSNGLEDMTYSVNLDDIVTGDDTDTPTIQYIEPSGCEVDEENGRFIVNFDYKIYDNVSSLEDIGFYTIELTGSPIDRTTEEKLVKTTIRECIESGECIKIDNSTVRIKNTWGFDKGADWEKTLPPSIYMFGDKSGNNIRVVFGDPISISYSLDEIQNMKETRLPEVYETCTRSIPPNRSDIDFDVIDKGISYSSSGTEATVTFDVSNNNYLGLVKYEYKRGSTSGIGSGTIRSVGGCPGTCPGVNLCGGFADASSYQDTVEWTLRNETSVDINDNLEIRFCNQDNECSNWFEYDINLSAGSGSCW